LINTYLASLPEKSIADNVTDLGLLPLKGKVVRKVYRGLEDKATVNIVYHGLYDFIPLDNMALDGLRAVLNNKLTERLREKDSGVYSPGVGVAKEKSPVSNYKIQISFTCATANTDKLIKAVEEEIALLKKNGISKEELSKFQAEQKRQFELRLRENNFWSSYIKSVYKGETTDTAYKTYAARLDAITGDQLKSAAIKFLNENSVAIVVLLPESAKK
jgi:zinc protease